MHSHIYIYSCFVDIIETPFHTCKSPFAIVGLPFLVTDFTSVEQFLVWIEPAGPNLSFGDY